MNSKIIKLFLILVVLAVLVWSGIAPHERLTWWFEALPVIVGLPIVIYLDRKYRLSPLVLILMTIHALILLVGSRYTYAHVPVGDWLKEAFDLKRNHYDRLGHFAQGFIPAIMFRELLVRKNLIQNRTLLFVVVSSFCLSFSAIYEFIEWAAAAIMGDATHEFLGTQGDIWDAHWDMLYALIGSLLAQLFLRRWHDKQIAKIKS